MSDGDAVRPPSFARRIRRGGRAPEPRAWEKTYAETDYRRLPWFSSRPPSFVVDALRSGAVVPRGRALDIGCGAGTLALYLARRGFEAVGVDVAPSAVEAARRRANGPYTRPSSEWARSTRSRCRTGGPIS